ncbi:MAG: NAD(P)H-dependent oxidoreductase [Flavobacteriales bacterium]|nr:NAD(P)H-dependent oxidoreductase [Flavobacteriales bacterium]MCB9175016.1 NAD(P)H-dependent oxidoreductase [Flavobacteriales bacterium]
MSSNVLMILAHPNIEQSIANKHISNIVSAYDNTEVRNLTSLYPDFKIDVKAEQEALLKADIVVFQYPLFWYGVPSLLKEWIDSVFTFGFAFGKGIYQLEGKKIIVSFTTGSSVKDYPVEVVEKIVFPFKGLADYCKMEYITTLVSHEIGGYSEEAKTKSINNADIHAKKMLEII